MCYFGWVCFPTSVPSAIFTSDKQNRQKLLNINCIFQFHSIYENLMLLKPLCFKRKMSILFIKCLTISAVFFPFVFVYGLQWMKPCKVSLLGFWLLECEQGLGHTNSGALNSPINFLIKLGVFTLNHWMWAFGMHGIIFGLTVISTMATICLQDFIERLPSNNFKIS